MIDVRDLQKSYASLKVLNGVSLTVASGEVTGILGPNGCGKTTLIKSILGLVVPNQGKISIAGETISKRHEYRDKIGYMPQNADFPGNLSVTELLDMLEDIRDKRAKKRAELIRIFDLEPHLDKAFGTLSGGTKQKVAAVAAFMFDPEILVLDEPTVGLDPVAVLRLKGLIFEAARNGKAVLLVTHMVSEIEQLVEKMYFLLDGSVRFAGTLDEVKSHAHSKSLEDAIVRLIQGQPHHAELVPVL